MKFMDGKTQQVLCPLLVHQNMCICHCPKNIKTIFDLLLVSSKHIDNHNDFQFFNVFHFRVINNVSDIFPEEKNMGLYSVTLVAK